MVSICVIPARYGSTRLPGKPLSLIAKKPMIQWVYERASNAKNIEQVLVATDHDDIMKCVRDFGGKAVMTSRNLESGTDRVAEAASSIDADLVINLQGDEPFISAALLDDMIEVFNNPGIDIATPEDLKNINILLQTNRIKPDEIL